MLHPLVQLGYKCTGHPPYAFPAPRTHPTSISIFTLQTFTSDVMTIGTVVRTCHSAVQTVCTWRAPTNTIRRHYIPFFTSIPTEADTSDVITWSTAMTICQATRTIEPFAISRVVTLTIMILVSSTVNSQTRKFVTLFWICTTLPFIGDEQVILSVSTYLGTAISSTEVLRCYLSIVIWQHIADHTCQIFSIIPSV